MIKFHSVQAAVYQAWLTMRSAAEVAASHGERAERCDYYLLIVAPTASN
jgi:hypothetical protein